jgi:SAM-dependent methyltransferase
MSAPRPDAEGGDEALALRRRYGRRAATDGRYSLLDPAALRERQGRQRAVVRMFVERGWRDLSGLNLVEVGCGHGGVLLEMLALGFAPDRLQGIELLPERFEAARQRLPAATALWPGEASTAPVAAGSQHLVLAFTVFSSLLEPAFQQRLADAMWRWLRPGGAVLWYDFTVDNPRNRDVRGMPLARVRELFPQGQLAWRRLTLAPPLARAACRVHPGLHALLQAIPPLRTHLLAWISKPKRSPP